MRLSICQPFAGLVGGGVVGGALPTYKIERMLHNWTQCLGSNMSYSLGKAGAIKPWSLTALVGTRSHPMFGSTHAFVASPTLSNTCHLFDVSQATVQRDAFGWLQDQQEADPLMGRINVHIVELKCYAGRPFKYIATCAKHSVCGARLQVDDPDCKLETCWVHVERKPK